MTRANSLVLREYQSRAVASVFTAWKSGARTVVLVAPTGMGKTEIALWLMQYAHEHHRRVLFVVNRRLIVGQTWDRAERYGVPYGVIMADALEGDAGSSNQIASIHTLSSWYFYDKVTKELTGRGLPPADLIIIDEAHQEAKKYRNLLKLYPHAKFLCLTATPVGPQGRSIVPDPFDYLVEPVKNSELIRDGFLLSTTVFAPSEPNIQGVGIDAGKEFNQKALGRAVREVTLFADVFEEWKAYQDQATVVFVPGIAYGRDIVNQYNSRLGATVPGGKIAYLIEAKTPQEERRSILERITQDGRGVVVSCDVLREGFDLPALSCAVDLQPNSQLRTYWQKVGRIKRPYPGQQGATYLDFAGNYWRFPHPNEDPEWPIGGDLSTQDLIERRRADNTDSQPIACPRCGFVRLRGPKCPNCGNESGDPVRRVRMGDGRLIEVPFETKKRRELSDAQRAYNDWKGCLFAALHKGWTYGQCAFIYKKKSGEWPKRDWPGVYFKGSLDIKRRPRDEFSKSELARMLSSRGPT
jgi:superfamily II DNA or RNA helicase